MRMRCLSVSITTTAVTLKTMSVFSMYPTCVPNMYTKGMFASHDLHYNMVESAIMCLNDVDDRRGLATAFSEPHIQYSDTMFEKQLEVMNKPDLVFKSYRLEGRTPETLREKNLDALCQVGTDYD